MESHNCKIAGRSVDLAWTQETAKRYAFRMGEIGGEPTSKQLTSPRTVATALHKVLWALLPPAEFARYATPEDLFVAVDHDNEATGIFSAINSVYQDRFADTEKKSSLTKSRSQESNSD